MTSIAISTLIVRPGLSGSNESYLVNLVDGLQALDSENEHLFFVTPQNRQLFEIAISNQNFRLVCVPSWVYQRSARIVLDQLVLPFWARQLGAEVIHYPGTVGSLVALERLRQVVTVHYDLDMAHMPSVSGFKRAYYKLLMQRSKQIASAFIVPSHSFGRSFAAHWNIPENKIHVIHHGVRAEKHDPANAQETNRLLNHFGLNPGYLLSVTNALPHKNVLCLLEAYSLLVSGFGCSVPLVLVGSISPRVLQEWGQQLRDRDVNVPLDRIVLTGFLAPYQVGLLYQSAVLMVTPTLTESSSMPVLEAMANGCPVVASDIPVHREISGQAGVLVEPRSAIQLAEACARVLTEVSWREMLVAKGLEQATHFSWERTAVETAEVYKSVGVNQPK